MRSRRYLLTAIFILLSPGVFAASAAEELMKEWQAEAKQPFSADRGKLAWTEEHKSAEGDNRACSNCHHADLTKAGEHIKTKKAIDPMAPSVNPERYTDRKKINKWLLRNCKWTMGRKCTAQEKGDFLAYLLAQ